MPETRIFGLAEDFNSLYAKCGIQARDDKWRGL